MPNYDFKCSCCGKVVERNLPYKEAIKGFECDNCSLYVDRYGTIGGMEMQFVPSSKLICRWREPYAPGVNNVTKDREIAFRGLEDKGKLPKDFPKGVK